MPETRALFPRGPTHLAKENPATVGIFLPSFILVLVAAPLLARHRGNLNVQGFVKGAYAAAIGTILGACILLGRIAIGDWLTAIIAAVSVAALMRWNVNNPLLMAVTAAVGSSGPCSRSWPSLDTRNTGKIRSVSVPRTRPPRYANGEKG